MRTEITVPILICFLILLGCQSLFNNSAIENGEPAKNASYNSTDFGLPRTPCGSISVYTGVPLYNLSGKTSSKTKEGAILYMTSLENLTINNSIYAVQNCFPVWRIPINDSQNFKFQDVPPGRYVIWLNSERFIDRRGSLILDALRDENNELDIALHVRTPDYSVMAFEIRAHDFKSHEKLV